MGDMNYNPYDNSNNSNNTDNNSNSNQDPHLNPYGIPPYQYQMYRRGNAMETAAIVLGTSSVIMCNCLYVAIPFGGLAILFALLSRGGRMSMTARARNGLILGIVGIIVTIAFYVYAFYIAIQDAGSLENLLRETCEMMGYDFETLFGEFFQ